MEQKNNDFTAKEVYDRLNIEVHSIRKDYKEIKDNLHSLREEIRTNNHIKDDVHSQSKHIKELINRVSTLEGMREATSENEQIDLQKKEVGIDQKHLKIAIFALVANCIVGAAGAIIAIL